MPFCDVCLLFWKYPGFFKVTLLNVLLAAGYALPRTYVIPQLEQQIWGDNATANFNWINAAAATLSVLFAPYFGRWSDQNSRRAANGILAVASNGPVLVMLLLGQNELGLYVFLGLCIALQPIALGPSGSPVCWAYVSDQLPEELRVLGFSINQGSCILAQFVLNLSSKALADKFPKDPQIFLIITGAILILNLLVLLWIGQDKPRIECNSALVGEAAQAEGARSPGEQSFLEVAAQGVGATRGEQSKPLQGLLAPLKLLLSERGLLLACICSALITLPDVAAGQSSVQILYQLLGIEGDHDAEQQTASTYGVVLPALPFGLTFAITGMISDRIGAPRFILYCLPVVSVLFAAPVILLYTTSNAAVFLQGYLTMLAYSCFPPLQAVAAEAVNPDRVGEAMGALSACKNLMCMAAPLLMGVVSQSLANSGRNDLLWIVYPICAIVMLFAWPFSFCLVRHTSKKARAETTQEGDAQ